MNKEKPYLNEKSLGDALINIFPNYEFVHNKQVPDSGVRNRPDYRCDELGLIVEFDGHRHYTDSKVILKDAHTEEVWKNLGYITIRIPYFIQLSRDVINMVFFWRLGKDEYDIGEWHQAYPHGFIDDKCVLPADFCSLGLKRFLEDLNNFQAQSDDIMKSLRDKCKDKSPLEVYPDIMMNNDDLINCFESMIIDINGGLPEDDDHDKSDKEIIGELYDNIEFWLDMLRNYNTYSLLKDWGEMDNQIFKIRYFPEYYKVLRDKSPEIFNDTHVVI